MIVYTIVAENYEKALEKAQQKHSQPIQVLYQKEFPYGIFNKKWVEIGYYLKSRKVEKLPSLPEESKPFSLYIANESARIKDGLLKYDFSLSLISKIIDEFLSARLLVQKTYTASENDEFVFSRISKYLNLDTAFLSNIPKVLCIITPYPIKRLRFMNNLINYLINGANIVNQKKINLINIGEELVLKNTLYTYNCDNPEGFLSIVSSLTNCDNIIVNLNEKYFYDEKFYRFLDEVKHTFNDNVSCSLLLPFFLKPSQAANLSAMAEFIENIVVSDADFLAIPGNIISISDFLSKPIAFFENSQGLFTPRFEDWIKAYFIE